MLTDKRVHEAMMKPPKLQQRSALWDFLWNKYDKYADQMRQRGFDWENLAARLDEDGVTDGRGKPPSGRVVQHTFYKIRLAKEGEKGKRRPVKAKPEIKRSFKRSAG